MIKSNIVIGNEVYWTDPDRGLSSGIYKIVQCPPQEELNDDSIILISNGGSEAEVFMSELS